MASVHSTVFVTNLQRISSFLFWFSVLAWVDAQQHNDQVSILQSWVFFVVPTGPGFAVRYPGEFSTWNFEDENPCRWVGVRCTANFTVEELDLSGWELPQLALEHLSGLKDLRYLDLSSSNLISGSDVIGGGVGTLTGLTHLDLSRSGLQGNIPANISNCTSLRYLSLEQNQLSGEITSLAGLVNLQVLLLANNNLTGPLPNNVSGFPSLVNMDLSDNMLSGTIPSFSNFPYLVDLKLDRNDFTAFEEPLSSSTNSLQRLSVTGNQLGGMIPSHITNLLNLLALNMSSNRLVGGIPSDFSRLWRSNLTSVDLSRNNLSGNIPADFLQVNGSYGPVTINVSYNLLSGSLPLDDGLFIHYSVVDLSHNQLSGPVPLMLNSKGYQGINSLRLQNNQLSGDIIDLLVQVASNPALLTMSELSLENNRFTGDLSRMVGKWSDLRIGFVGLSNNYLQMSPTETIPDPLGATLQNFADNYYSDGTPSGIQFHLAGNNFSGVSLPTKCFWGNSTWGNYLEVLDLSNNQLQGAILGEVFNEICLPQLQSLDLSNNNAVGPFPESIFANPNLVFLDVSNNYKLFGSIPVIPSSSGLYGRIIHANNTQLCGGPLRPCTRTGVPWWVLLLIVVVSMISVVGSGLFAMWRWRVYRKRHQQDADLIKALMERESATLMPLRELKKATDNFSESTQVGEGGFGTVYTGKLKDGTRVAIKRSKREGSEKDKQIFLNEVRILSQVNHRFLVKLLGCCMEDKIALLVFEFIPNGTLQDHLHGKTGNTRLTLKQRLNIAVQTADALSYLHSATKFPIYHRDVKSANILLDDDFNAKVTDFGISKLAPHRTTHVSTVAVQGTMGYIDPEYYTSFRFTDRSDVYSFGVVLLELISAKPAIDFSRDGEETGLVNFAGPRIEKGDLEPVIDPTLLTTYLDPAGGGKDSILNVGRLAMKCLDMRSKARPSMNEVWKELQDLRRKFSGTSEHLNSVNQDDSEAPHGHHICLFSESWSGDSAGFTVQSDDGSIQMSQFSL